MNFIVKWPKNLRLQPWKLDPSSLQTRLTLGIALFSVLGLGSVALWTSWKMQQLLIVTHKHNIEQIAERFPRDVEMYSEMWYVNKSLQKAIDNLTLANVFIWVKNQEGTVIVQSQNFQSDSDHFVLKSLAEMPSKPLVYPINERYFVLCGGPLTVNGMNIGKLYIALDISRDQKMLVTMVMSLSVASILAIIGVTLAITVYIQRSLMPLRHVSQLADHVNADILDRATVSLERAPSEVKELARTLDTMLARLSNSWEQQRQFVSNVSHELRTPLTIVSGYLQSLLRRGNNLTETQKEAISIASGEAQRTIELLKDLLELARADSGEIHFNLEAVVLNDLVTEVVEMAKQFSDREIILRFGNGNIFVNLEQVFSGSKNSIITEKKYLVSTHMDKPEQLTSEDNIYRNYTASKFSFKSKNTTGKSQYQIDKTLNLSLIEVMVDRNRLKQVLLNLIDNAVKYSGEDSPIILNLSQENSEAIIQVCDKGQGISLSQQAKIFERFYRVDEARNRSGGAGLGLSIVKTLVEGMGGTIQVYSKLDKGSIFTVKLPVKK
ncbi:MAG: HAMP domain-containing histidine kinase [Okeania sp. SIO3B5]|uniref:sensor histidine kinase n=1 Tax=Okeania sp. SIO3B5 TaxID=2607811 RepID=UPI0014000540|nr:HAMP domain-containing sensor histidine kinase [Okeania sp. SIO3B5]NEO57823.1 HAMP domain-containing histidine kinase [Okeania sp. SIO3B5]